MNKPDQAEVFTTPKVIIGCWQLSGGHGALDTASIHRHLRLSAELGLTAFDCADIYTGVEELLGEFLASFRLESPELAGMIQVHTKFVPDLDSLSTLSKEDVERIIDRSLQRLRLEELHLVQFHWWDLSIPRHLEVMSYLVELRHAGKIRHLGLTNFGSKEVQEFLDADVPIVSNQVQYSVLDRRPEISLAALCEKRSIKLLCYGATAGGFLAERYVGAAEPTEPLENRSLTKYRLIIEECGGWERYQGLLSTLSKVAKDEGVDLSTLAQRFILTRPGVGAVIVGARSENHLLSNRENIDASLSRESTERVELALSDLSPVSGDVYSLERNREGPHGQIMRYNLNCGRC
jgi:aryl-alcohol dehydrogenase-like predicted oxidoreductase